MSVIDILFAGRSLKLDDGNGKDLVAASMQNGTFEAPLPILLMAVLDRLDGAFLDVGANSGLYSVLAGINRSDTTVIAFEPLPAAISAYEKNIRLNNLQNRVDLKKFALSDRSGTAEFFIPDQSHGFLESSCSLEREFKGGEQNSIPIDIRTLDELNIKEKIAVIKADIEGHEHAFLKGASKIIKRDRPMVFLEVLPPANFGSLDLFIQEHDYLDFRLHPKVAIEGKEVTFDALGWNHAFIPNEKKETFFDACRKSNLDVVRRVASRKVTLMQRLLNKLSKRPA